MRKTIDLSKRSLEKGNEMNACILYDPIQQKILCESIDKTNKNKKSINHCIIEIIKDFSNNQINLKEKINFIEEEEKKIECDNEIINKKRNPIKFIELCNFQE